MKKLFKRLTKRDLDSLFGRFFKNSAYQFSNILVAKAGALIFSLLLARLLMPSLFGLYSLSMSIILIFSSFSDLGISKTAVIILSRQKSLNDFKKNARYLFKLKLYFALLFAVILGVLAFPLSVIYGKSPLFIGLIGGTSYLIFSGLSTIFEALFQARQDFKTPLIKEAIFQIIRIILVIPAVFILLKMNNLENVTLFSSFFLMAISYFFATMFMFFKLGSQRSFINHPVKLKSSEKAKAKTLLYPLSFNSLSEIFFSYFDLIILGFFVLPAYLGYYQVAMTLLALATPFSSLALVLLPIFGRVRGQQRKSIFGRSVKSLLVITFTLAILMFFLSKFLISLLYGQSYLPSINILRILTPLFILVPMTTLYYNYLISTGKQFKVSILLISSSAINLFLNLFLILFFFRSNPELIVFVVAGVSVLSKTLYMIGLKVISN